MILLEKHIKKDTTIARDGFNSGRIECDELSSGRLYVTKDELESLHIQ